MYSAQKIEIFQKICTCLYLSRKVDTESYFPLSTFSEVDNTESISPFSFTEVDSISQANSEPRFNILMKKVSWIRFYHRYETKSRVMPSFLICVVIKGRPILLKQVF